MASQLKDFKFTEVLSANAQAKSVYILGTINDAPAIVTLTRGQIPDAAQGLPIEEFKLLEENGIYSWGLVTIKQDVESNPGAKVDVIYPATETHIAKYRQQPNRSVTETPEQYKNAIVPYIDSMRGSRLDWVRAILFEGAEADRVLYRDDDKETGFVFLPNSRWDRKTIETLYLLVIVMREDLYSIRDLRKEHLPLLKKIRSTVYEQIHKQFGLDPSQIKLYFHYQPSYYHLHVHVANVNMEQSDVGRSILFDNVIDVLESRPDGYGSANISYIIGEGHKVWKLLSEASDGSKAAQ